MNIFKKVTLLTIKYGPSLMAITCCLKIHYLSHSISKDTYELRVNIINWILNILLLGFFYCAGKYFGYCWKHQSLCRIALGGYIYYPIFLIFKVPHELIHPLALYYVIFVCIVTILYKKI